MTAGVQRLLDRLKSFVLEAIKAVTKSSGRRIVPRFLIDDLGQDGLDDLPSPQL